MEPSCEVCGREGAFAVILLEGAKLAACGRCARMGKILYRLEEAGGDTEAQAKEPARKPRFDEGLEVVEGFGEIIRRARQKSGLSAAVVAERINEKASYIENIEHGKLAPTLPVARKLERELGIKLIEKSADEVVAAISTDAARGRFGGATLGDAIVIGKKKKKK